MHRRLSVSPEPPSPLSSDQVVRLEAECARLSVALDAEGAALTQVEQRYRALLESVPDYAVIAMDLAGRITSWNVGAENVLGWAESDVLWHDASLIFTLEDRTAGVLAIEMQAARSTGRAEAERWHLRRDASLVLTSGTLAPVRDVTGQAVGYLKILRDRTKQSRVAEATRRAQARLQARADVLEVEIVERTRERDRMWQLSHDLLGVARRDVTLVATNPAWAKALGWPEVTLLKRSFLDLVHPNDVEATALALHRLADGLPASRVLNRCRHQDDTWRHFAWTAVADAGLLYLTGRDVTAETEQAEALNQAEEALRQSQKMEALGQLTGGIAHDFNNMLQGVTGNLELLERRIRQGRVAEAPVYVEAARRSAGRASALTSRLLAFARRQRLEPTLVIPTALIEGMAELIRGTAGHTVAVEFELDDSTSAVLCDPGQLENALLNLAINARDAMPEGGQLLISTRRVSEADIKGQEGAEPGDYVEIAVSDDGAGMDAATKARAFEPFFTTKPVGQGTGLGLSQLYGFVRQSGGTIRLDSAPGRGTTIRLYLPHHEPAALAQGAATSNSTDTNRASIGETLVLIEDEGGVRGPAAEHLRDLGYQVIEAADGLAGLRLLSRHGRVDLLVTDVGLPGGLNGRQVAEAAREERPDLPVLFVTGYAGGALDKHLAPGMGVLGKPFVLANLAERVRAMLDLARR